MTDRDDDNHALDYQDERRRTCPHCRGTGQERIDCIAYACPDCDGTGERICREV